ncbi:IS66 family transposase [Rhizobium sp. S9]|uniref:IS66 family transposase n=1 Tax=Rhizobium sp. S9 TaxID=2035454 RepID=UPI001AEF7ED9|nr:IS66 family transposase [Rhizobium sp. S9]
MEVLTTQRSGREAHHQWPDEVKALIVSESLRPGVTVNEVAERHGLKANHLSSWRTLGRQGKLVLPEPEDAVEFAAMVVETPLREPLATKAVSRAESVVGPVIIRLGGAPPGVAFTYAPGRGGIHAERILQGFSGILQVDGYAGYNRLIAPERVGLDIRLAYCWAHARRKLVEITRNGTARLQMTASNGSETSIGSRPNCAALIRRLLAARQERSAPLVADMQGWLVHHRARVATKSPLGEALAYIAKYWDGLKLFLTDGRIEIDNNSVERTIRPIALNRKNALFAGHDVGAENWATIASLIETCKFNAVDPQAYLTIRSPPS